jgi:hypothetical protein
MLGNTSVGSWVYRACVIQGTQQIYVSFLWYWGSRLAAESQAGLTRTSLADSRPVLLTGIGLGIAAIMWIVGTTLFLGLPDYYAQSPGKVPAFYKSLPRRKIVLVSPVMHLQLVAATNKQCSGSSTQSSSKTIGSPPPTDATGSISGPANTHTHG